MELTVAGSNPVTACESERCRRLSLLARASGSFLQYLVASLLFRIRSANHVMSTASTIRSCIPTGEATAILPTGGNAPSRSP